MVAESEDLSVHGVFVRTEELFPVGAVVNLQITLPDGPKFRVVSRVAHLLSPSSARSLGRRSGMGFSFLEHDNEGRDLLVAYVDDLAREIPAAPRAPAVGTLVIIADPSEPMRARLRTAIEGEGSEVVVVDDGVEAHAACLEATPDAVVAATDMPVMDGWTLIEKIRSRPSLARIPVVLTSEDAGDITRLRAYRLGVADFIPRPFTDEELRIRLRRVIDLRTRTGERSVLRGDLADISLPTLLSLFDFERKSGIIVLTREQESARVFLARGRVVKVEGPVEKVNPRRRILMLLDWADGEFEYSACEVVGADEIAVQTSQLLLEHARIRDQEERDR